MKGLNRIPSTQELLDIYNFLEKEDLSLKKLLESFSLSRFDARLGEILIQKIGKQWKKWNPVWLNEQLKHQVWPSVMGVLLEHVALLIPKNERPIFKAWKRCVMKNISKEPGAQFFIGLHGFAGRIMAQQSKAPVAPYTRWGYLAADLMVNKSVLRIEETTTLSPFCRRELLNKLLHQKQKISVSDYMIFLEGKVSRRTAELDLANCPRLKKIKNTRARIYSLYGQSELPTSHKR